MHHGKRSKNMASVNYTLRMEETDKKAAERVFKSLGMSFATGMNVYVKKVGRERRIPFSMDLTERASLRTLKDSFEALQKESIVNGTEDMSLDDINAEIAATRKEKRGQ